MEISNYFGFKSPNAAEDHLKAGFSFLSNWKKF
jgi:hypothetical protein